MTKKESTQAANGADPLRDSTRILVRTCWKVFRSETPREDCNELLEMELAALDKLSSRLKTEPSNGSILAMMNGLMQRLEALAAVRGQLNRAGIAPVKEGDVDSEDNGGGPHVA